MIKVNILKTITRAYADLADAERAAAMKAYMRDQFAFYGIPKPERSLVNREFFKATDRLGVEERIDLARQLWKAPQRELQYFAMEMIARKPKEWPLEIHELFDEMILQRSWWDTVDFIAVNCCGPWMKKYPEMRKEKLSNWTSSASFWMHRTALLFQLKYKGETDEKLLFSLCRRYAPQKEFFLRKAIGWVLREYSKTNPAAVSRFIGSTPLSPLSVKEGSKYL